MKHNVVLKRTYASSHLFEKQWLTSNNAYFIQLGLCLRKPTSSLFPNVGDPKKTHYQKDQKDPQSKRARIQLMKTIYSNVTLGGGCFLLKMTQIRLKTHSLPPMILTTIIENVSSILTLAKSGPSEASILKTMWLITINTHSSNRCVQYHFLSCVHVMLVVVMTT